MTRILFVGDVVGEAGLVFLEAHLPGLIKAYQADIVVANGENMAHLSGVCMAGLLPEQVERLLTCGVDIVTSGNHAWDTPNNAEVLAHTCVLRPLNVPDTLPGRGATIVTKQGLRIGVVNVISRTAFPPATLPLPALEDQLELWHRQTDLVIVDMHGESVVEKQALGFALDGRVSAFLGTHTHVQTHDLRVLPRGTAFVSDVGMTGPAASLQGYAPEHAVQALRDGQAASNLWDVATGPVELGAVWLELAKGRATQVKRLPQSRL